MEKAILEAKYYDGLLFNTSTDPVLCAAEAFMAFLRHNIAFFLFGKSNRCAEKVHKLWAHHRRSRKKNVHPAYPQLIAVVCAFFRENSRCGPLELEEEMERAVVVTNTNTNKHYNRPAPSNRKFAMNYR